MSAGLLESESTGGAVARRGFEYQDAFVLQWLPRWLTQDAFSHVVSEAVGDVEVCYHARDGSTLRVLHEAKDYALTSTQFWSEVARFKDIHETAPREFPRFVLVCRDFNSVVAPLISKVERLRGVGSSFPDGSVVLESARREVVEWIKDKGQSEETARFVLDRVEFVTYSADVADAAFAGEVEKHLPTLDLRAQQVAALRERCKALVARSSAAPVYRASVEAAVVNVLGAGSSEWSAVPTSVLLTPADVSLQDLGVNVAGFTRPDRGSRTSAEWVDLSSALAGIGDFVKASRSRRGVRLDGKQRTSVACLVGYMFSAARGFVLDIEHNGVRYRTDLHERARGPFFAEHEGDGLPAGRAGVACIGFPTPVGCDARTVGGGSLEDVPRLELSSTTAIVDLATLNLAVTEAKQALVRFRSARQLELVHLFVKAPAVFSMALGHRLNGVGNIQLYDWVDGRYMNTVLLAAG